MEQQFKNICQFYSTTHKLKEVIRSGWKLWHVSSDRLESVAEHIYGTQMLAFAVISELNLDVDINKVVFMLAFHELGECTVGDITPYDNVDKEEKHKRERLAILKILSPLAKAVDVLKLFDDYEMRGSKAASKEAKFCYAIDQLECFLQIKYYDEMGKVDLNRKNERANTEKVRTQQIQQGAKTFSQMFINNALERVKLDQIYVDFAHYLRDNKVFE